MRDRRESADRKLQKAGWVSGMSDEMTTDEMTCDEHDSRFKGCGDRRAHSPHCFADLEGDRRCPGLESLSDQLLTLHFLAEKSAARRIVLPLTQTG